MMKIVMALGAVLAIAVPATVDTANAAGKKSKLSKISGCTSIGVNGCYMVGGAMLTAEPGVVIPPAKTFIVATGTMKSGPNLCFTSKSFHAKKIIATKRLCK